MNNNPNCIQEPIGLGAPSRGELVGIEQSRKAARVHHLSAIARQRLQVDRQASRHSH